jgi:hypothetical protein
MPDRFRGLAGGFAVAARHGIATLVDRCNRARAGGDIFEIWNLVEAPVTPALTLSRQDFRS